MNCKFILSKYYIIIIIEFYYFIIIWLLDINFWLKVECQFDILTKWGMSIWQFLTKMELSEILNDFINRPFSLKKIFFLTIFGIDKIGKPPSRKIID